MILYYELGEKKMAVSVNLFDSSSKTNKDQICYQILQWQPLLNVLIYNQNYYMKRGTLTIFEHWIGTRNSSDCQRIKTFLY